MPKPDFKNEDLEGTAIEFAPGAWVCGTKHPVGGIENMSINNRVFIFQLTLRNSLAGVNAGNDCLFIVGLGNDAIIATVKKLERKTRLKAVALLCNGGNHHIFIKNWYDAFEELAVWVCPTKVPDTFNGYRLMNEYPDRWELVDNTTKPHHVYQLYKYFGDPNDGAGTSMQVDCVVFNQLYAYKDSTGRQMDIWCAPENLPQIKDSKWVLKKFIPQMINDFNQPVDDIVFYHRNLKLIITGQHFEFSYVPPAPYAWPSDKLPWDGVAFRLLLYFLIDPGRYRSMMGRLIQRIRDPKIHAQQWQEVFNWNFIYSCGFHDPPTICGPVDNEEIMDGEDSIKGYMQRELQETGEWDGEPVLGSWFPWRKRNKLQKLLETEEMYLEKHGPPPPLRYGGPNYDHTGMPKGSNES